MVINMLLPCAIFFLFLSFTVHRYFRNMISRAKKNAACGNAYPVESQRKKNRSPAPPPPCTKYTVYAHQAILARLR